MQIKTNNKPRHIIYGYELTKAEKVEFDYLDDSDSHAFVRFKGQVYDLSEFMRITASIAPHPQRPGWEKWHGYKDDSFYSGVLIRYVDSDTVVIGTYTA